MQTTTYALHIPKPCHQGWHNMQPNDGGRYCSHCSKTVVDFTQMSDAAIQQYFVQQQGQGVCGRFNNTQLQRVKITLPGYVLEKRLPVWKKFLVVLLFCFGSHFLGIDVWWGGGQTLYAQTVTKAKGVAKTKKRKLRMRDWQIQIKTVVNYNLWPEDVVIETTYGFTVTKPEPDNEFPKSSTCELINDTSVDKGGMNNGPNIIDQPNHQQHKETPPQQIPLQRKEYLLPLIGRRRKKLPKV
jgi:hypothetical protein